MAEPKELAARLRAAAAGTVEWRVQHPVKKHYCIAFGRTSSLNPERDARRWLEDHRTRFPGGRFVNYEVAEVRYLTELESLALEAADALDATGVRVVAPIEELAMLRRDLERLPKSPGKNDALRHMAELERAIAAGVEACDGGKKNG